MLYLLLTIGVLVAPFCASFANGFSSFEGTMDDTSGLEVVGTEGLLESSLPTRFFVDVPPNFSKRLFRIYLLLEVSKKRGI